MRSQGWQCIMSPVSALLLLVALCAAAAAAQEFPFKNGPLDPSLHSNKIFFNIDSIEDIAGVWEVKNFMGYMLVNSPELRAGAIPVDQVCQRAHESGVGYGFSVSNPQTAIILPGSDVEGQLGQLVVSLVSGHLSPRGIEELTDEQMRLDDGTCYMWRAYFDWEVGKPMYVRNRRLYVWEEDGQVMFNRVDYCVSGDFDHPFCSEGSFIIDGQEKTGVILDVMLFYECVAGPCLELPHTLPGFVKTQGWQPRD